jgi:TonB family protein
MNCANMKEKGISLLASLLFHLVLLFVLIRLVPPVRVILFRHAADVRIVEPGVVLFPRMEGSSEVLSSGSTSPPISSENLSLHGSEVRQRIDLSPGIVYLKNLNMGRSGMQTTENFHLIPSPKREGTLSLGIGRKEPNYEKEEEERTRSNLDFSAFNVPPLSSLKFNKIVTNKKGIIPSRGMDVAQRLEEYDLAPWVKQVVDKIRNNWIPPPIDASLAIGEVRVLFVVGKKGDLVDLKIVAPSLFSVFDQTTLAAIRSSVPFPPLPQDFPDEILEAYLVFEFHE